MKTIYLTSLLICFFLMNYNATSAQDRVTVAQQEHDYVILSAEKFAEIEAKMNLQDDWNPIRIEGYSKAELVAFYVQSYSEETIEIWADFAYKKIQKFEETMPSAEQEIEFEKLLDLPKTAENTHRFMMLMTTEQIETIGY